MNDDDQRRYMPRMSSILQHADPKFVEIRRHAALSEQRETSMVVARATTRPLPTKRTKGRTVPLVGPSPHLALDRSAQPSAHAPADVSAGGVETGVVISWKAGPLGRAVGSVLGVLASGLLLGGLGAMVFPGRTEVSATMAPMGASVEWLATVPAPEPAPLLAPSPVPEVPVEVASDEPPVPKASIQSPPPPSPAPGRVTVKTRGKVPARPRLIFERELVK
jgi:predicted lipid-binding transport protein (Tim44 family)